MFEAGCLRWEAPATWPLITSILDKVNHADLLESAVRLDPPILKRGSENDRHMGVYLADRQSHRH
jgi:hypothetical protein